MLLRGKKIIRINAELVGVYCIYRLSKSLTLQRASAQVGKKYWGKIDRCGGTMLTKEA